MIIIAFGAALEPRVEQVAEGVPEHVDGPERTQSGNALLRAVTSPQAQQQSQTLIDRLQLIGADPTEDPGNAPLVDGTNLVHQCV